MPAQLLFNLHHFSLVEKFFSAGGTGDALARLRNNRVQKR
jgi:hypothetical protein